MNFELGKRYIVDVTEKGIIPLMEFDESKWYNKDCDDLDFLTDEEKAVVVNNALNEIKAEIEKRERADYACFDDDEKQIYMIGLYTAIDAIDKYGAKPENIEALDIEEFLADARACAEEVKE